MDRIFDHLVVITENIWWVLPKGLSANSPVGQYFSICLPFLLQGLELVSIPVVALCPNQVEMAWFDDVQNLDNFIAPFGRIFVEDKYFIATSKKSQIFRVKDAEVLVNARNIPHD